MASLDALVRNPPLPKDELRHSQPLRHAIVFGQDKHGFYLEDESIEFEAPSLGLSEPLSFYKYHDGKSIINVGGEERKLPRTTIDPDRSILAQRHDPETYPEISYLANVYETIRIYREWTFGRNTILREPQRADMRNDRLEEDFSNLGLILNKFQRTPRAKQRIIEALRDLYEGLTGFEVIIEGGTVQVFFTEGDFAIPATRLSDGTLRYLCLLAVLCDPEPPPLICIEEPELGLHPDMMPDIAELLVDASQRTQLIVTTHSDILVDAMTERPEAVLVCEKHNGMTGIRRLDSSNLQIWLEKYRLGELWISGEIGGKRW
jgi:predicted ATPase